MIVVCAGMIDSPAGALSRVTWIMAVIRYAAIRVAIRVSRSAIALSTSLEDDTGKRYYEDERCNFE